MVTPVDRASSAGHIDASTVATLADLAAVLRQLRRREARHRQGRELTYHQLATRTGWSATIIGAYLNGTAMPPTDRFDTLVVLLGAGAEELGPLASARDRVADSRRRRERAVEAETAARATEWTSPRELPAPPTHFVAREDELTRLDAVALGRTADETPVAVVTGMAGVGKTALALRWAHRVAEQFPDGQLYIDLRGFDPSEPVDPSDALAGFLRSLGLHLGELPQGLSERAARYRTLLAGRRVLIVLDNALTADQIRPLMPGSRDCAVLVTSRESLPGLVSVDGAARVALDVLSTQDAAVLLRQLIGDRVDATPDTAASLAVSCGHLPLAIRIAAEVAARRVAVPLRELVDDLSNERTRLDTLDTGESRTTVRTVLSWSTRALSPDAARLFRLLGLAPGPHLTTSAIASIGGLRSAEAGKVITELGRAHLLVESTPGRYLLHDLLRAYAAELAQGQLEPADRDAAIRRLLDHYLHTAIRADAQLEPGRWPLALDEPAAEVTIDPLDSMDAVLRWFATERSALVAAVRLAAQAGEAEHAWRLTWAMATYLDRAGDWRDMAAVNAISLRAAPHAEAAGRIHHLSAAAALRLGLVDTAFEHFRQALELLEQIGDERGLGSTHSAIAKVYSESGAVQEALHHHRESLALARRLGNRTGQAACLNNLGYNHARLGHFSEALIACQEALALARELGNRKGEAHCSDSLGFIHRGLGEHDQAIEYYHNAIALFEQSGARLAQASAWTSLGDTYADMNQADAALDAWRFALAILEHLDQPGSVAVRSRIATGHPPRT